MSLAVIEKLVVAELSTYEKLKLFPPSTAVSVVGGVTEKSEAIPVVTADMLETVIVQLTVCPTR